MRDFEDSTLWRISAYERMRLERGSSVFAQLGEPTMLPTTLLDASFGTTEQWGVLATTWNSMVAYRTETEDQEAGVFRTGEVFPKSRNRNAFFARISQHVPASRTTASQSSVR